MSKYERQSFLGTHSEEVLRNTTLGIIGLCGGGSHIVMQAAHLGVGNFVLVDDDTIDERNLNRLVGGTERDVAKSAPKVRISRRVIKSVNKSANVKIYQAKWQEVSKHLRSCDVIIGGLDSVIAKDELDAFCKRFLIPYIDMGMDVHSVGNEFLIAGQVVLTTPGGPCLRCMGIVTAAALTAEAKKYGAAGGRPQVIWPNGVLASTAIGLFTQLLLPWNDSPIDTAYFEYDGNKMTVNPSKRLVFIQNMKCTHWPTKEVGDPRFDIRRI